MKLMVKEEYFKKIKSGEKQMKCTECSGHCNKKGYPSVSKYSAYCDSQRGVKLEKTRDGKHISRMGKIKRWIKGII